MASLTVLMPAHNAGAFLQEAVASVLSQDFPDFTLLLLDDGSTDGSVAPIARLSDPRIVISRSEKNVGLGATLTRGLDLCDTEFFVRMDADDLIPPSKFSRQLRFLRDHPAVGMVGTQFHYFGTAGSRVMSPRLPLGHEEIVAGLHRQALTLIHGSLMGRTAVLRTAGGYRVRGMGEDWDMFLRVAEISQLANLADDHYAWRLHPGNTQLSHLMEQQLGIQFACDCASRRARGEPERSYGDFLQAQDRQPLLYRLRKRIDLFALAQYRTALAAISCGSPLAGNARLALAAACSPLRTLGRLRRMATARLQSGRTESKPCASQ